MHHTMSFYEGANIIQTQVEPLKWDLNGSVFLQGSIRYRMNLIQDELHVMLYISITLLIAILYMGFPMQVKLLLGLHAT